MILLNFSDENRKEQRATYGTWFSEDGNANYFVNKCIACIEQCKTWSQNLEELLSVKKTEMLKVREKEIRQFLSLYSPEEIAAFQSGS